MPDLPAPRVVLSADRTTATLRRGPWMSTCKASELAHWLDFYRDMTLKAPGVYAPWVAAITAAMTRAGMAVPAAKPEPNAAKAGSAKRRKA